MAYYIFKDRLPISMVERSQVLMTTLDSCYEVPSDVVHFLIMSYLISTKDKVAQLLGKVNGTTNLWSSIDLTPYSSLH